MRSDESQEFMERLERHPELYERFKDLLQVVENADGDALTADEAEERVVQEIRHLGHEALQAWATHKTRQVEHKCETRLGLHRRGKKNSTGRRGSVRSKSLSNFSAARVRATKYCVHSVTRHR